ncbi:DUF7619 domain-containing protein [Solirubrum puertoriconensis]|uniref:IPT/TIG domain-containing protein n=1 Tax=Solirubrum puertoriconensis TaxID=1751427 RepID=A0A9X0L5U4_SOLP1|nr:IPT/TIG domain-containing protein [Solirubrum puertoriconensis]KUG09050.1 hypothetical protein ASU33_19700 [Solirubrum puertoriconensis]
MIKRLLLFCGLLLPLLSAAQVPADFKLQKIVGTPVSFPQGVAVDGQGFIYVLERSFVTKLDAQGNYVGQLDATSPDPAKVNSAGYGLCLDAGGNLYVVDFGYGEVRKYSPAGQLQLAFSTGGYSANGYVGIPNPETVVVDPAGNIYVAGSNPAGGVRKFNAQGQPQWSFTLPSANPSSPVRPSALALDRSGRLLVLGANFTVSRVTSDGQLENQVPVRMPGYNEREDVDAMLAVDAAGNLYTTISQGNSIRKFDAAGNFLGLIGSGLSGSTRTSLAFDAAGNLYATNRDHGGGSKLYRFNPSGQLINTWGNMVSLKPGALDAQGNYYCYHPGLQKVIKYNPAGVEIAQLGSQLPLDVYAITLDPLGNIYLLTLNYSGGVVDKLDPSGRPIRRYTQLGGSISYTSYGGGIAADAAGTMYITDLYGGCIRAVNAQGQPLPPIGTRGTGAGQLSLPQAVAVDQLGYVYATDNGGQRVQRFTPSGQLVREYGARQIYNTVPVGTASLSVDQVGNMYVNTSLQSGVQVFNAQTGLVRTLPQVLKGAVTVDPAGSRLITQTGDLIRFYANGRHRPLNLISGHIFEDRNGNCVRDADEDPLAGIAVVAQPGNYYSLTDQAGQYTIAVDTGTYYVQQLLPGPELGRSITPLCATPVTPTFRQYGLSLAGPEFGNLVSRTPYLSVQVGSNRRRRCFRNTTTVSYANTGFAEARNATVTVALPPQVQFISASVPHTRDAAGHYVFAVGSLPPQARGHLVIQDSVVCGQPELRGQTVCTQAWITPLNQLPAPPAWLRGSVTVQGRVEPGNQARFVVRNTGTGALQDSLPLRVYQNGALARLQRYRLGAGDSLVLRVPATEPVVRVEVEQPPGHPRQRVASATVELRGLSAPGQVNAAMHSMPPNDPGPEVAEDCQPIVDSFDPNDKQVVPAGVTDQRYTPTTTPLSYRIRFQNTGTDDAYRVVLVDTLDNNLDLSTLQVGAASHPYRLSVAGQGRPVLTFTFAGLSLPPSARNEPASHGFVDFTIRPKAGLAPKTLVENCADIFFDYNEPVRTNTTVNRLYDMPLVVNPAVQLPPVLASPAISGVAPGAGRAGTLVTITGERLAPAGAATWVRFNGTLTPVLSQSASSLTVRVPAGAGTGFVEVVTADGSARSPAAFTVYQPPTLAGLSPAEGRPGSAVTLSGTHFSPVAAEDTVYFGGIAARVLLASPTELRVEVPAGARTGVVELRTPGGVTQSALEFTVWYPPGLTSLSPGKGKAGDRLTLHGHTLAPAARTTVTVAGVPAPVLQVTATSVLVRVPAGAQTGRVRLETPGGVAISAGDFTIIPAPRILAFTPAQASVGELVTVTGENFLEDGQPDTLSFGGVRAPVLSSTTTSAVVRVPRGAQSGPLAIAGRGGRSRSVESFHVVSLPAAEALAVYPNPTDGQLTLDWQRADFELAQVRLFDVLGKLISVHDLQGRVQPQLSLDLRGQRQGLYLLLIETSRGLLTKRVTVY